MGTRIWCTLADVAAVALWLLAAVLIYDALAFDVTIDTGAGRVANAQLIQIQSNEYLLAVGAALLGALSKGFVAVVRSLDRRSAIDREPTPR